MRLDPYECAQNVFCAKQWSNENIEYEYLFIA